MNMPISDSFEKLLESFLVSLGHDPIAAKGSGGFEFESGGFNARILLDSTNPARLVAEVDVRRLDDAEVSHAELLLMLHRLNEAARPTHGWTATIDEENLLLLSLFLPLAETDGVALQAVVDDALARAESLGQLVRRFSEPASAAATVESASAPFNPMDRA